MPRRSPFVIVLSEAERATLEKRAHSYSSPYRDVVRARIVLLAAEDLDNEAIAQRLDLPRQIVSKWRERFFLQRLPGLRDEPRSGRPSRAAATPANPGAMSGDALEGRGSAQREP